MQVNMTHTTVGSREKYHPLTVKKRDVIDDASVQSWMDDNVTDKFWWRCHYGKI